jgi:hypothetical protein
MSELNSDGNQQSVSDYLWSVAAKKVGIMLTKGAVAVAAAPVVTSILPKFGIHIDTVELRTGLPVAVLAGAEWLHDYLKVKYGWKWL